MDIQEIKDLLSRFDSSSLTEFDLKQGDFELYFNKNEMSRGNAAVASAAVSPVTTAGPTASPAPVLDNESLGTQPAEASPKETVAGTPIVTPLVGVVYLKPAPDKPNFKAVGDRVNKGDVLCIVEAMKVMNEITSDIEGEIVAINVENEQIVEFNQTLFTVKEG